MDIEKIESILTEFNLTREVLDFEISEEMTEDELRTKVQEFVANQNSNDNGADNGSDGSEPKVESFSATYRTKQDAINSALPNICERDENGKCIKEIYFYLVDFDDNFAYVEKNTWVPGDYSQEKGRIKYTTLPCQRLSLIRALVPKYPFLPARNHLHHLRLAWAHHQGFPPFRVQRCIVRKW